MILFLCAYPGSAHDSCMGRVFFFVFSTAYLQERRTRNLEWLTYRIFKYRSF